MFRIPIKNSENHNFKKIDLQSFFQILDQSLKTLKIKSYSASMPTLEDVFLNVAAEDNKKTKEEKEQDLLVEEQNYDILFNSDLKEDYKNKSKFVNDFKICMKRRFLITIRDIKGILMELLCPVILILFGLSISKIEIGYKSGPAGVNISEIGKQKILFSSINNIDVTNYYLNNVRNVENQKVTDFTHASSSKEAIKDFVEKIYDIEKDTEDCNELMNMKLIWPVKIMSDIILHY